MATAEGADARCNPHRVSGSDKGFLILVGGLILAGVLFGGNPDLIDHFGRWLSQCS